MKVRAIQKQFEVVIPEGVDTRSNLMTEFNERLTTNQEILVEVPLSSVRNSSCYLALEQGFPEASH